MDLEDLFHVWVLLQVFKGSSCIDLTLVHDHDLVSKMDEVNCVGNQYTCLFSQNSLENLMEDSLSNMSIQSRDWIVEKNDIWELVDSSSKTQSSLLASRKVDTSLSDLSHISGWEDGEIVSELARLHDLGVLSLVKWTSKEDVISY